MRPSRHLALAVVTVLLGLLGLGCGGGLAPFTREMVVQHNLSEDDVKNRQSYVSHRITLRREIEAGGSQITGSHKLLLLSGKTIEEVVIEEETPGVAVAVQDTSIAVSFENGTSLEFSTIGQPRRASKKSVIEEPD